MIRAVVSQIRTALTFWGMRRAAAVGVWFRRLQIHGFGKLARVIVAVERVALSFGWDVRRTASPWARLGAVSVAVILVVALYPIVVSPFLWPSLEYSHARFSGANLFDAQDRWLGVIPGQLDFVGDFSTSLQPSEDHKAVLVEQPPEQWWEVLTALEDRYRNTPRSIWGIDVGGLARSLFWDLPRGRVTGGSSLSMQLYRSMQHYRLGPAEPKLVRVRRKLEELAHAPVLSWKLKEAGLASYCATHIPLVVAAVPRYGQPVYGIDATARIIFDRPLSELDLPQLALMAAAVYRPFVIEPTDDGWTVNSARFSKLVSRAARGIRLAYDDDPRAAEALSRLANMTPPTVAIDPELRELLPSNSIAAFRAAAQPYRRALYLARGEMIEAIGGLQEQHGRMWREDVQRVQLTLDAVENRAFKVEVESTLQDMQSTWGDRLNSSLLFSRERSRAQVVIAAADENGRMVRMYTNSSDVLYGGIQRLRHQGSYQSHREDRPLGSVSKVALALYLASQGTQPDDMLCNRAVRGFAIRNPNGDRGVVSCRAPRALYTVEQVFARSLNLPLIHTLRAEPVGTLEQLATDVGFNLPPDAAPRIALTLGRAAAGLQRVHLLMHDTLARVAQVPLSTSGPTILVGHTQLPRPDIASYLDTDHERVFVETVLSASVRPGGTLHRLSDYTPERNRAVHRHLAKTGTSTAGSKVRDLIVTGAIEHARGRYTYIVLLGSPIPRDGLGQGLSAGDLAPLVRTLFQSLELASTDS